jgi:hypothetical protein
MMSSLGLCSSTSQRIVSSFLHSISNTFPNVATLLSRRLGGIEWWLLYKAKSIRRSERDQKLS